MWKWVGSFVVALTVGCQSGMQMEPSLVLSLTPSKVADATPITVKVSALRGDGTVGSGTVKVSSLRGSLKNGVELPLDSYGTARTEFVCDPAVEAECLTTVRVLGEWVVEKSTIYGETRLNVGVSGAGGGSGAGSGGTGGGGGTGAGGGGGTDLTSYVLRERCSYPMGVSNTKNGFPLTCCGDESMGAPCPMLVIRKGDTNFTIKFKNLASGELLEVPITAHVPSISEACANGTLFDPRKYGFTFQSPAGYGRVGFGGSQGLVSLSGHWGATAGGVSDSIFLSETTCAELTAGRVLGHFTVVRSMGIAATTGHTFTYPYPGADPQGVVLLLGP